MQQKVSFCQFLSYHLIELWCLDGLATYFIWSLNDCNNEKIWMVYNKHHMMIKPRLDSPFSIQKNYTFNPFQPSESS